MTLKTILEITQLVFTLLLVGLILLQSRGTGLSATFGGTGFATARRGVEKVVFTSTIILLVVVTIVSTLLSIKA